MARGASARFGLDKICGVTVDTEARVASVELDDGVWLHDCVVHKYLCVLDGVGGGRSFLSADFIECDDHCVVDSVRDVEKSAGNDLHAHDAAFVKFRCVCGVWRVFYIVSIRRCEPFVGRVLGARGHGVLEALQGFAGEVGHGDVNIIPKLVPFDGKPAVLDARGVDGD